MTPIQTQIPTPPIPSTHSNATHISSPPLPLHSLIGIGWVWVWSWTVGVTIQFPSASSAVVDDVHQCIASFWVQILITPLFLFYIPIPLFELLASVVIVRSTILLHVLLWSCSIQPLRIDMKAWQCHLFTILNFCVISTLMLPWRNKLMYSRWRVW